MMSPTGILFLHLAVLAFALVNRLVLWKSQSRLVPDLAAVALMLGDGLVVAWLTMPPGPDLRRVTIWLFAVAGLALAAHYALETTYYWVRGFRWGKVDYDAMAKAFTIILQKAGRSPADLRFFPNGVLAIRRVDQKLLAALEEALADMDKPDDRWLLGILLAGLVFLALLALITGLAYLLPISY
ncbi:hypothetical protein ACLGL1_02935 [Peptococcus simiae]|uniref:hypothetical protein n=1 Tax=Peptococcus simiae TaxID=1643805 RepID=UPI003980AC5C